MASIIERVKALQLPSEHFLVIGGCILDAYGLRPAEDIDLVVSDELYEALKQEGTLTEKEQHGELMLFNAELDIWKTWTERTFNELAPDAIEIEGIYFAHPDTVIAFKRARGSDKDLHDIELLERYLNE